MVYTPKRHGLTFLAARTATNSLHSPHKCFLNKLAERLTGEKNLKRDKTVAYERGEKGSSREVL